MYHELSTILAHGCNMYVFVSIAGVAHHLSLQLIVCVTIVNLRQIDTVYTESLHDRRTAYATHKSHVQVPIYIESPSFLGDV